MIGQSAERCPDLVRRMWREGHEIGSHTFTHRFLTALDGESLRHELTDSRAEIEKHTGKPVRFLSYPYGDYNPAVMESAERSGYDAAVTTWRGPIMPDTPALQLKRYLIHNDTTLDEFKTFLP